MESPTVIAVATAVIVTGQAVARLLAWLDERRKGRTLAGIHDLVNSGMGMQLRLNVTLARRLAERVGEPADLAAAALAELLLAEYEARQAAADARGAPKAVDAHETLVPRPPTRGGKLDGDFPEPRRP